MGDPPLHPNRVTSHPNWVNTARYTQHDGDSNDSDVPQHTYEQCVIICDEVYDHYKKQFFNNARDREGNSIAQIEQERAEAHRENAIDGATFGAAVAGVATIDPTDPESAGNALAGVVGARFGAMYEEDRNQEVDRRSAERTEATVRNLSEMCGCVEGRTTREPSAPPTYQSPEHTVLSDSRPWGPYPTGGEFPNSPLLPREQAIMRFDAEQKRLRQEARDREEQAYQELMRRLGLVPYEESDGETCKEEPDPSENVCNENSSCVSPEPEADETIAISSSSGDRGQTGIQVQQSASEVQPTTSSEVDYQEAAQPALVLNGSDSYSSSADQASESGNSTSGISIDTSQQVSTADDNILSAFGDRDGDGQINAVDPDDLGSSQNNSESDNGTSESQTLNEDNDDGISEPQPNCEVQTVLTGDNEEADDSSGNQADLAGDSITPPDTAGLSEESSSLSKQSISCVFDSFDDTQDQCVSSQNPEDEGRWSSADNTISGCATIDPAGIYASSASILDIQSLERSISGRMDSGDLHGQRTSSQHLAFECDASNATRVENSSPTRPATRDTGESRGFRFDHNFGKPISRSATVHRSGGMSSESASTK